MKQPWPPAEATERINALARSDDFDTYLTDHARERMEKRDLLSGDILYVLKNGFVYEAAEKATRGYFKYTIATSTPNSGSREIKVVVIPDEKSKSTKIVTVMWADKV